ncbi:chaperone modulatory protein CbpM [Legionella jordanis]|uniref:chaperone modulator CbpM n=1 Tax=Legionella jordanis TaxID=456 RepID=UPI000EFDBD94|nr:chaperone modulator CbpM [Legionella jordanis]RMX20913.1 chaperone modulatory protein CbpM [Legionella jordanis]
MTRENKESGVLEGEDFFYLSLQQVSCSFGVSEKIIFDILDEGIVETQFNENKELQFNSEAVGKIRMVLRLHQDLGVNFPGAALALQLLQEIERLENLLSQK